jgi:hypothetical protein
MHAVLGVVLVGGGELAVEGGRAQVAVAVDQHLPAHLHGLGVDAAEQRAVFLRAVEVAAVVRQRDVELAAAEHAGRVVDGRIDRIALVGEDAVEALHVRQLGDLVADEVVEADARDAAVDLVVDPGVAAVVVAVLVGGMDVVGVADAVLEIAVGLDAHDLFRFIGDAPADQRVRHETRDAQQLAARRQAEHAHVTGVAAAPQTVVGIQFAGFEVHIVGAGVAGGRRGLRRRCGGGAVRLLLAAGQADRQSGTGQAHQGGSVEEFAPPRVHTGIHRGIVEWFAVILAHGVDSISAKVVGGDRCPGRARGPRLRHCVAAAFCRTCDSRDSGGVTP